MSPLKSVLFFIALLINLIGAENDGDDGRKPIGRINRGGCKKPACSTLSETSQVGGVSAQVSTVIITQTLTQTNIQTMPGETVLMTQTEVQTQPITQTVGETVMMTETQLQTETVLLTITVLQSETINVTETQVQTTVETQTQNVTETQTETVTVTQSVTLTEEERETVTAKVTMPAITVTRTIVKATSCAAYGRKKPVSYGRRYGQQYKSSSDDEDYADDL